MRDAIATGTGTSRRHSETLGTDMLYVAVATSHPEVAVVRLALPLTDVAHQVRLVQRAAVAAIALALALAFGLAWLLAGRLSARVNAIAASARRYADQGLLPEAPDATDDELATVSQVLDGTVRQLGRQVAELARDRARMEAILGGMAEGVLAVDSAGQVQLVNRAAGAMLTLGDDAVGRHYVESLRHPGTAALLSAALSGREPAGLELVPARAPDRRLLARAAPVAEADGTGAVLVLHDITDLHRASQMRRDFVANVSHELRTPLTAIRGYIEALGDDPPGPEEQRRFLEVISRHAARMERLVRDLLRLASLEARQEPVERASHAVEPLLRTVVADLASSIERRRQVIEVEVAPDAGTATTDQAKVQDALRNIVENAVNYSPEASRIRIEATRTAAGLLRIAVIDQGPGIPESDLARIFERFYRVDKARSRESGGTGLGLSIVKHLVGLLGGEVTAANRPGGGAEFAITLPDPFPTGPEGDPAR